MNKTIGVIFLIAFLYIQPVIPLISAAECDYGNVNASIRLSNGVWRKATSHPVLKRGETFDIKVVIGTKTVLQHLFLKLHEFGTPVFDVIEGPTEIDQILENHGTIPSGTMFVYTWTVQVRPNTSWVTAYAPLEVFMQFNKNDTDERRINFDVLTAYIIDELWENCTNVDSTKNFSKNHDPNNHQSGPVFVPVIIIVFIIAVSLRFFRFR